MDMAPTKYEHLYRHAEGHLRVPFAHVGFYLSVQGVSPSTAERRAIENAAQFLVSLSIFARRLRGHLAAYRPESWVDVPFYELFLDVQSLFLFTQQYLEDIALIVRMSLPNTQRHQMPAAFKHLSRRLREQVLTVEEPLKTFLDEESTWFEEIAHLRDDICHRTAYDKVRSATFPDLPDLMRAGGGAAPFLSAVDLRTYVGELFRRILALSCVAERFVYARIVAQHPGAKEAPPAVLVAEGEIALTASTPEPKVPLSTVVMILGRESVENLEYFLACERDRAV